jgi:uncharacterized protein (DUF885 family)
MSDLQPDRASDPGSAVNDLAERFWESILELNPTLATFYGDERYGDRLEDPSPPGRARHREMMEQTARDAAAIPTEGLSTEDRITRDMLQVIAELAIEEDEQGLHQLRAVDQMQGPQQLMPQMTSFQPVDTPERLEAFIGRLQAYPAFMAANADILREALGSGLTAPSIVTERTIAQLERMLAIPIEEAIIPGSLIGATDEERERIRDIVRDVIYPADDAFLETLRGEYRYASREEPGLWSAPNGDQLYRTAIRSWTTLEMEPEAIHQIGLDDIEAIDDERREIARAAGFGDDVAGYRAHLNEDPANTPGSKAELVARAEEDIERAMAVAPQYFGRLPKAGCEVRPVEEYKEKDAPFAYYYPPSGDGQRNGIYYANGYDLHARKYTKLASTTYHEAAPGHHFQITLEMENEHLNRFRRLGARMVGGAYVEGWGLYSERLADEMGLYRSEGERFGMLDAQAWRAARLVVDTGMHALRWERQRSIDFLLGAGLSETDAVIETDRYICWPGQALTYKLGQRQIESLRREISARDGSAFDLREFHDQVLGHGSLPLATLARELPTWVAAPA